MKRVRIDYTIYSPNHRPRVNSEGIKQEGHGECWDFPTFRGAKRKAREFGVGSLIIRNFNKTLKPDETGGWWQKQFCWVWNGFEFRKAYPVFDTKWIVADHHWFEYASLNMRRSANA